MNSRRYTWMAGLTLAIYHLTFSVACSDVFEQESDHVSFVENHQINTPGDTIYSVTGILAQLQPLADRTILLGEVRGDLADITQDAHSDLQEVSLFSAGTANPYNQPRDYYAVINNCNYYITHVADSLRDNRNKYIFLNEVAAVKAIRAWTYLQLALNYGEVPFFTEPLLTKEQSDADYPRRGIKDICEYFISDLQPYADNERVTYPGYGTINSLPSQLFFFPVKLVLGELQLWAGQYKEAALSYYSYLAERGGTASVYPTGIARVQWNTNTTLWQSNSVNSRSWTAEMADESYSTNGELITMIPGSESASEGFYSELRNLYNETEANGRRQALVASVGLKELSASQVYCLQADNDDPTYVPQNLDGTLNGDLRLCAMLPGEGKQCIKFVSDNVHIYRKTMVFLRLAEAMNAAGYPRFAFAVLSSGINNTVLEQEVIPYYSADSTFLRQFNFPASRYVLATPFATVGENTQGIHSRGCGYTPSNGYYQFPDDYLITDSLERIAYQQRGMETLLLNEGALEFAFEGQRWYDLMRFALRADDPAVLADRVYARRGEEQRHQLRSLIGTDLYDPQNWYLPAEW